MSRTKIKSQSQYNTEKDYHLNSNSWQLQIDKIIDYITLAAPECDSLIFVPHFFLHLLPLHALPIQSSQEVLLDRFVGGIRYIPSCSLLKSLRERNDIWDNTINSGRVDFSKPLRSLLAFQNPTTNLPYFDSLPYSDIEVQTIKDFFPVPFVFANTDASVDKFSMRLWGFNCIHFSCHGIFDYVNPLESSLILADGYRITLSNIIQLSLRQCFLVTLSACETGQTDVSLSDEYVGLPSAFFVAGARAVVYSLWVTNDISTSLLMIKFYQNHIKNSASISSALNKSQLWLKNSTVSDFREWIEETIQDFEHQQVLMSHFVEMEPTCQPFQNSFYWAGFCAITT